MIRCILLTCALASAAAADDRGARFFEACAQAYLDVEDRLADMNLQPGQTVRVTIPQRFLGEVPEPFPISSTCAYLTEERCATTTDPKLCTDRAALVARDLVRRLTRALPESIEGVGRAEYDTARTAILSPETDVACPGEACQLYWEAARFMNWRRMKTLLHQARLGNGSDTGE